MSDHSDDERRSDSHHSDDEYDEVSRINNFEGLLGVDADRGRAQFSVSNIPNELGDEELISFDCQNDVMVFVGANGKFIVRDTKTDQKPIQGVIPSAYKGFVSPDGHHVLISALDGALHYYSLHNRKAVVSQKVNKDTGAKQAMVVETVCWSTAGYGKAVTTGEVLLGSKAGGLVFAACVEVSSSPPAATFEYCRHVLQLPESDGSAVQGLKVVHNPSMKSTLVMATTTSRMYPFVGKDRKSPSSGRSVPLSGEDVLKLYKIGKQCEILDMGLKSNVTRGTLAVMRSTPTADALGYAWLSSTGVTHGIFNKKVSTTDAVDTAGNDDDDDDDYYGGSGGEEFKGGDESAEVDEQFGNQCHIPIGQRGVGSGTINGNDRSTNAGGGGGVNNNNSAPRMPVSAPLDIAITAFHMFVLYETRMVVLNHPAGLSWRSSAGTGGGGSGGNTSELTESEVSARIRFDPYGSRIGTRPFVGMTKDEETRRIFYYNRFSVFELTVEQEHVGQWRLFLGQAVDKDADKALRVRSFEAALKLSFGSASRRDLVTYAYGKYLLELRAYKRAAAMFAQCSKFEDIFMLLREMRRPSVLLDFLVKRYQFLLKYRDNKKGGSQIPEKDKKKSQQLLNNIFSNNNGGDDDDANDGKKKEEPAYIGAMESQLICLLCAIIQFKLEAINRIEADPEHDKAHLAAQLDALRDFTVAAVDRHRAAMQQPAINNTIGRLFTAHGRVDLMLAFSEKLGQVRYAIHFFISRGRYSDACKLLIDRCSVRGEEEAWYAFAPRLIQHVPIQLIGGMNAFKVRKLNDEGRATEQMVRALDPLKLIPAFVHYRPEMNEATVAGGGRRVEGHKVIPYLRSCLKQDKNMDPLVHNFYVSLLAEYDVEILKSYLQQDDDIDFVTCHSSSGEQQPSSSNRAYNSNKANAMRTTAYDPEYALRQCIKHHRHQYCVPLYKRLGLYEDAINIALESSVPERDGGGDDSHFTWEGLTTVTDEILDKRPEWMDPEAFKGLWLSVARRVVDEVGTRDTLSVVERSRGVLKLEDILPYIGDSTVIQDFKEAIVNALNEYTDSINTVKQKEEEAKRVSTNIKREIDTLQSRFGYVSSRQQCLLCHQGVFSGSSDRPFLVFPNCKHVFHEECARNRMTAINAFSLLKAESDELPLGYLDGVVCDEDVATLECIYCGECAIAEISAPMFGEEENSSWDVPDFGRYK